MSEHQETFAIIVGQDEHKWPKEEITYNDAVAFYLQDGGAKSNEYLIKYSEGPKQNPSGTLSPAGQVKVKNGMHFRISGTGES
jgi:hypothetical protein